jgi:hypothetical protein
LNAKDFELTAKIIASLPDRTTKLYVANTFSNQLGAVHERFNALKFLTRCLGLKAVKNDSN